MEEMSYTVSKEDFTKFIKQLSQLTKSCTDIILRNGIIRQKSDSGDAFFDIKTDVPIDANLQFVKSYVDIFKVFVPVDDEGSVTLTVKDNILIISDEESYANLTMGDEKYMTAYFIPDEKMKLVEQEFVSSFAMTKNALKKLVVIGENFATDSVTMEVDSDKAKLTIASASKTKNATITTIKNIQLEQGTYVLPYTIFTFPFEEDPEINIFKSVNDKYALKLTDGTSSVYGILDKREI